LKRHFYVLVFFSWISMPLAQAQFLGRGSSSGLSSTTFGGFAGYLGFGVAGFTVQSPSDRFRMDEGNYVYVGGERQIGKTGLFITLSANFMTSDGQTFYDYTRLDGDRFTSGQTDITFQSQHWQLGLGLKGKLFPTTWFRPYGEAGGLFGYHTIDYSGEGAIAPHPSTPNATPGEEKLSDALTGFGYYGEAGLEIDFTDSWGIRAAVRYQITETRAFDTLADNRVKYEARIFQFAVARRF